MPLQAFKCYKPRNFKLHHVSQSPMLNLAKLEGLNSDDPSLNIRRVSSGIKATRMLHKIEQRVLHLSSTYGIVT